MRYTKDFVIGFAEYFKTQDLPVYQAFDIFEVLKENEKLHTEPSIYMQVLQATAEMTNVTMSELAGGKKYGEIPICKQISCAILHELKCSDESISKELLIQMGGVGSIRSRRLAAVRYESTERNYRLVLMQLRTKFNVEIPAK